MSQCDPLNTKLFLGAGSREPGLWQLDTDTNLTEIVSLPTGRGIYALDMDPDSGLVVLGTRNGQIKLLHWPDAERNGEPMRCQTFYQGEPLLALCLLEDNRLAATDTTGRCLLWHIVANPQAPRPLETTGEVICSLVRLPEQQLVGLSAQGQLIFWSIPDGAICRQLCGPRPPARLALVPLRFWPQKQMLIYPAQNGSLAYYRLDDTTIQGGPGHTGDCYVILPAGDRLITIGRDDGLCKRWKDLPLEPSSQYSLAQGVIAGELWQDCGQKLILIFEQQTAGLYELTLDKVHLIQTLTADSYRTVVGPSLENRRAYHWQQQTASAQTLTEEIRQKIDTRRMEGLQEDYEKMITLGFANIALALQAYQAAQDNETLTELRLRHRLHQEFQDDATYIPTCLQRYGLILEKLWRLQQAQAIYGRRVTGSEPGPASDWLSQAVEIINTNCWLIEPDRGLTELIEAATIVGQRFTGQWLLKSYTPLTLSDRGLNATDIVNKYRQVQTENQRTHHTAVDHQVTPWLSRESLQEADLIYFRDPAHCATPRLHWVLRIETKPAHTLLTPLIIVDAGNQASQNEAQTHNQTLLNVVNPLGDNPLTDPGLQDIQRGIVQTLRRLRTELLWQNRSEKRRQRHKF